MSNRTNKNSFHGGNADCNNPKCRTRLGRMCMNYETLWHCMSPKDCTWRNSVRGKGIKATIVFVVADYLLCTYFKDDVSCHIHNPKKQEAGTLKLKTHFLWPQYVITHSCGSPHTARSSPINLILQIDISWQIQCKSIGNSQSMISFSFPMSLPFCKLYHCPSLSEY